MTPAELLDLADAGAGPAERGPLLTAAARPDVAVDEVGHVSLGASDEAILDLRCATFGDELTGRIECPACGLALAVTAGRDELPLGGGLWPEPVRVEVGDVTALARAPTVDDLAAAACAPDVESARCTLVERCLEEAHVGADRAEPLDLPDDVLEAVGEALVAADPRVEQRVELTCAACGHEWPAVLDPALFFWQELRAASTQILDDVHQLATGYGWSEAEVLELSARRRRRYVERLLDA